jgi:hypothetical protein
MAEQKAFRITGTLHGVKRQIGKIGGDYMACSISSKDLALWDFLVANAEQAVTVTIEPAQGELGLAGGEGAEGEGDEPAENGDGKAKRRGRGPGAGAEAAE